MGRGYHCKVLKGIPLTILGPNSVENGGNGSPAAGGAEGAADVLVPVS